MSHIFLLFGMSVGQNYGCDAIAIGTATILRSTFPDCEIWLPCSRSWRHTTDYKSILGADSAIVIKGDWRDTRVAVLGQSVLKRLGVLSPKVVHSPKNLIRTSDCILSLGGDLYTFADKEKDWPYPYPIMEAGNSVLQLGKPYVIWCASIGPLEKAGTRLGEMVDHLKACRAIILREQMSFSYLRDTLGVKDHVYLAADPAFVMEPEPFDFPFLNNRSEFKLLAVNFSLGLMRHVLGELSLDMAQAMCEQLANDLLTTLPIKVLFVPHVQSDFALLNGLHEKLISRFPQRVAVLPARLGARRTKWAVSQSNALLTMRFHCSLAGFSTTTPTLVLVSTSKCMKICNEMYGNLEYAVNINNMNNNETIRKVKYLLDNEAEIRAALAPTCENMRRRAFSAGDILAKVL